MVFWSLPKRGSNGKERDAYLQFEAADLKSVLGLIIVRLPLNIRAGSGGGGVREERDNYFLHFVNTVIAVPVERELIVSLIGRHLQTLRWEHI